MRPARTKESAKNTIAIVYTHDVSARRQPNSCSSGSTKTLQAYNEPRARFISTPPKTGSHRLDMDRDYTCARRSAIVLFARLGSPYRAPAEGLTRVERA